MEKYLQGRGYEEETYKTLPNKFTKATIKLYTNICEKLPRTPVKFHYIFNLRDLSRVYEGMCQAVLDKFPGKEGLVRLWRNECLRVFADRLISVEDKELVAGNLLP